jgi:hypothetical protein
LLFLDGLLTGSLVRFGFLFLLGIGLAGTIRPSPAGGRRRWWFLARNLRSCLGRTAPFLSEATLSLLFPLSILFLGAFDTIFALLLLTLLALRKSLSSVVGLQTSSSHALSNTLLCTLSSSCHTIFMCATRKRA